MKTIFVVIILSWTIYATSAQDSGEVNATVPETNLGTEELTQTGNSSAAAPAAAEQNVAEQESGVVPPTGLNLNETGGERGEEQAACINDTTFAGILQAAGGIGSGAEENTVSFNGCLVMVGVANIMILPVKMEGNGGGDEKMATFSNGCLAEEVAVAKRPTMIILPVKMEGNGGGDEKMATFSNDCLAEEVAVAKRPTMIILPVKMEGNGGGDEKMATFSNGCLAEEVAVVKRPTMIVRHVEVVFFQ
ncbi:uncharacterized protein LOC143297511 [Babylonia areolata]|uniref:uncharacterized protein LOC143297511 n=1 Tax=Babylonia areolata TaxID=304850 RepID=UPI003FD20D68